MSFEADPAHARRIVQDMGLGDDSKGLKAPIAKDRRGGRNEEDEEMGPEEARRFRGIAASANYLGIDRPDAQYATKEICRD